MVGGPVSTGGTGGAEFEGFVEFDEIARVVTFDLPVYEEAGH